MSPSKDSYLAARLSDDECHQRQSAGPRLSVPSSRLVRLFRIALNNVSRHRRNCNLAKLPVTHLPAELSSFPLRPVFVVVPEKREIGKQNVPSPRVQSGKIVKISHLKTASRKQCNPVLASFEAGTRPISDRRPYPIALVCASNEVRSRGKSDGRGTRKTVRIAKAFCLWRPPGPRHLSNYCWCVQPMRTGAALSLMIRRPVSPADRPHLVPARSLLLGLGLIRK